MTIKANKFAPEHKNSKEVEVEYIKTPFDKAILNDKLCSKETLKKYHTYFTQEF